MTVIHDFSDIYNVLKKRKEIKNLKNLAELLGNNYSYLSEINSGRKPLTQEFVRNINNVFKTDFSFVKPLEELQDSPHGENIPLFNKKVFGTISPAFDDNEILMPIAIKKIPHFSRADGAVQVHGHSMKGYINHGDWIVIKRIVNKELIIYGEPYLVITKSDSYRTVKFIKESHDDENSLSLVPYNIEQFDPQDIPKEEVLEIYSILGLFRSM